MERFVSKYHNISILLLIDPKYNKQNIFNSSRNEFDVYVSVKEDELGS